jgi:hypothetical protein
MYIDIETSGSPLNSRHIFGHLVLPKVCREFRGDPDVSMSMFVQSPTSDPSPSPHKKKINPDVKKHRR